MSGVRGAEDGENVRVVGLPRPVPRPPPPRVPPHQTPAPRTQPPSCILLSVPSFLAAYRQMDDGRHRTEFYRMWRAAVHAGFTNEKALKTIGHRRAPHVEEMREWLLDGARRGQRVTYLVRTGGDRFEPME